jgi:hypothetical protein
MMRFAVCHFICAMLVLSGPLSGFARGDGHGRVIVTGSTVDIGLAGLIEASTRPLSPRDMESLAVAITDRYHDLGYTTCYVEKVTVGKNGIVEIRVRESRIADVEISGLSGHTASRVREILVPVEGELYNRLRIRERAMTARRSLRLAGMKITTENHAGGPDVRLKVSAAQSPAGRISGGMRYEPIYGFAPVIHWEQAAGKFAVAAACESGYRDGDIRKLAGDLRLFALISPAWSLFAGYRLSKTLETWESRDSEYGDLTHAPSAGTRLAYGDFFIDLSLGKSFISLEGYGDARHEQSDEHLDLAANYSNRNRVMISDDDTAASLSMTAGKGTLYDDPYLRGEFTAHTTWSPLVWLKVRPGILAYHTTARERYYWTYVFDRNMPGFVNDYTASRTRYVAGLDLEFETYPETVFLGPVANSGYFLDESGYWTVKTGGGFAVRVRLGSFYFHARYAWELAGNPRDGSAIVSAEGTF